MKQLIIDEFKALRDRYKAGAGGGGRFNSWARNQHYLQVVGGLQAALVEPVTHDQIARLHSVHGIGKETIAKCLEIYQRGTLARNVALGRQPEQCAREELMKVWGIGKEKADRLIREHGCLSLDDVRKGGAPLYEVMGLGPGTRRCIELHEELICPIPRDEIAQVFELVQQACVDLVEGGGARLRLTGSYRRGASAAHDVDLLLIVPDVGRERSRQPSLKLATTLKLIEELHRRELLVDDLTMPKEEAGVGGALAGCFYMGVCRLPPRDAHHRPLHRRVDIRCFSESEEPFALLHLTGSAAFNRYVSRVANAQGLSLSEKGIRPAAREAGNLVPAGAYFLVDKHGEPWNTEQQIFDFLGLQYVEPHDRENKFSIRRAGDGVLWFRGDDNDGDEAMGALQHQEAEHLTIQHQ